MFTILSKSAGLKPGNIQGWEQAWTPSPPQKKNVVSISFYRYSVIYVSFDVIPVSFHGVVLLLPQILKDFPASGG